MAGKIVVLWENEMATLLRKTEDWRATGPWQPVVHVHFGPGWVGINPDESQHWVLVELAKMRGIEVTEADMDKAVQELKTGRN